MVYRSLDMEHDLHKFVDERVKIVKTMSDDDDFIDMELIDEASDYPVDTFE